MTPSVDATEPRTPNHASEGTSGAETSSLGAYRDADRAVTAFLEHNKGTPACKAKVLQSLKCIDEALDRFGVEELAMSFNGGKDCHVMLILILAQIYRRLSNEPWKLVPLPAIHIRIQDSFPQVDEFVDECASRYHLRLVNRTDSMKEALAEYLHENPKIQAIFVGTRRQDPYGENLKSIQKTDHGWPNFTRIHAVLEWDYGDIWNFLRVAQIPYLALYDDGYTSLGGVTTTVRNPGLKDENGQYLPAYLLTDYSKERVARFQHTES